MIDAFARPESAIEASAALVGVAACISSLEWLAVRGELAPRGCFAWRLSGSRPFVLRNAAAGRALSLLFEPPGVLILLAVRALVSVLLVAAAIAGIALEPPLVALGLTSLVFFYRGPYGRDGSDQMILVIVAALAAGTMLHAERLAVVFVACQLVAAYFIAGVAKLRGREWRNGDAVPLILSTRSYGAPGVGALLREQRWVGRAVTWTTMSFEFLFPLALLGPQQVLIGALVVGALFHVTTAATMGLNVFLWAFLACYPCVLYLSQQV